MQKRHGYERNSHVCGRSNCVTGKHSQAAAVGWHPGFKPDLHREIGYAFSWFDFVHVVTALAKLASRCGSAFGLRERQTRYIAGKTNRSVAANVTTPPTIGAPMRFMSPQDRQKWPSDAGTSWTRDGSRRADLL